MRKSVKLIRSKLQLEPVEFVAQDIMSAPTFSRIVLAYEKAIDEQYLIDGLERVLRYFPLLSGRLVNQAGRAKIFLHNQGVHFTTQIAPLSCESFSSRKHSKDYVRKLTSKRRPWQLFNRDKPLMEVQLTHFSDRGSILAVSIHQQVADRVSMSHVLEAWCNACRGQAFSVPDSQQYQLDAREASSFANGGSKLFKHLSRWQQTFVNRLCLMSVKEQMISIEKRSLSVLAANLMHQLADSEQWVSTQDILVAQLWRSVHAAQGGRRVPQMSYGVDLRAVEGAPSSVHFIDNIAAHRRIDAPLEEFNNESILQAAQRIRRSIETIDFDDPSKLVADSEEKQSHDALSDKSAEATASGRVTIDSGELLAAYPLDFGAGEPIWYDLARVKQPQSLLIHQSLDGRFFDIHLRLPKKVLKRFEFKLPAVS
ncbi:transferase family protein [Sinobacterium caligoides]|uniref:Transferase family protein n=1 Tax=Sinobacterium caligoides TaxID=933926 RepID=A0A3N2E172_9GAMM|nr:acyltransferase [Sinobacterium caligoides]ROS05315.1 transferase family protein [Sinobacterium caligoides]